jgi:hypothetical protein
VCVEQLVHERGEVLDLRHRLRPEHLEKEW